jgi:hypothetical protein
MNTKIVFKDYGKGKEHIILVDKSNSIAFAPFGKKDTPYEYLYKQLKNNK